MTGGAIAAGPPPHPPVLRLHSATSLASPGVVRVARADIPALVTLAAAILPTPAMMVGIMAAIMVVGADITGGIQLLTAGALRMVTTCGWEDTLDRPFGSRSQATAPRVAVAAPRAAAENQESLAVTETAERVVRAAPPPPPPSLATMAPSGKRLDGTAGGLVPSRRLPVRARPPPPRALRTASPVVPIMERAGIAKDLI